MPPRNAAVPNADLPRILLAAARFPHQAAPDARFGVADIERIAHRFPGILAARLDGFGAAPGETGTPAGTAGGTGVAAGFEAALLAWGEHRFEGPGEAPKALAARLGIDCTAGTLAAAALTALGGISRAELQGFPALDAPASIPDTTAPLSRLFRLLVFALRLRRPDLLTATDPGLPGVLDWVLVFGLAEHRLWHLLPAADHRLLLQGSAAAPPLFLRAVLRFRPDLRALSGRPEVLRDWFRHRAAAEYDIRLAPPAHAAPVAGLTTVIGPWKHVLGISDDVLSTCRALDQLGLPHEVVDTKPARWLEVDPDKLATLRARAAELPHGDRALFCDTLFEATLWALRHWPRFRRFRRVDLFAPWELPGLPEGWQAAARLFDTVMTPSMFSQAAFAGSGPRAQARRVLRVTSSVELVGRPAAAAALMLRRVLPLPASRRVFVCVFDFSSYLTRKNPEAVVRAFAALRRQVPNATLVLKTTRARRSRAAARRLRALLRGVPDVVWVDGAWSNALVEALLLRADALVSLHRSEGFGRNIAKTLLLGRPVVVTDWSGNADMRPCRGYFGVPYRLRPLGAEEYVLGEGQHWAEPDARGAVRQMRAALALRDRSRSARTECRFGRGRLAHRLGRILHTD